MPHTCSGACFCGDVRVEVSGPPAWQGFCHCESCRAWSGAPVTAGDDLLRSYGRPGRIVRYHCSVCGGAVLSGWTGRPMADVLPAILEDFRFEPASHVNYAERMIDMKDGLPKFRDMPAGAGGSDEMMEE